MIKTIFKFNLVLIIALFLSACSIISPLETEPNNSTNKKTNQEETKKNPAEKNAIKNRVHVFYYFSFACEYCRQAVPIIKKIKTFYKDKIKWHYRHFPRGEWDHLAAEASECARKQGKFEDYYERVFQNPTDLKLPRLLRIALQSGLNIKNWQACLESGLTKDIVFEHTKEARTKNLRGTPSFIFDHEITLQGLYHETVFRRCIDERLKKIPAEKSRCQ